MSHSLIIALGSSQALGTNSNGTFHYSRSGRFTAPNFSPVFLGGLIVDDAMAPDLESELEEAAARMKFQTGLVFGTGKYHALYYSKALQVLERHPHFFWGAFLTTDRWEADTFSLPIWRRQAEAVFLETLIGLEKLRINCVRHSRGQDANINRLLQSKIETGGFETSPSVRRSSRIYQVSSVATKCFGATWGNRRNYSPQTTFLIEKTEGHFQSSPNRSHIEQLALDFE